MGRPMGVAGNGSALSAAALSATMVALGCGPGVLAGDDASTGPDAAADALGGTDGSSPSDGSRADAAFDAGMPVDAAVFDAGGDAGVVGSPGLFAESIFEMDFSRATNGQYRGHGGPWQDFDSWNQAGVNGGWSNTGARVQTTDSVRTELLANALGPGRVLRTWIEAGDRWRAGAAYPRTELTSGVIGPVAFGTEWRLEMRFYADGDVSSSGDSIIGFQFHHNGDTGSPPFGLFLSSGNLRFYIEESPSGPFTRADIFPLAANTQVDVVMELKFGYVADGAYVRLWVNGTQYVDISDHNVGYPDLESTAGYWKFCSLYDWGNYVAVSRSVYCGPEFKLLARP